MVTPSPTGGDLKISLKSTLPLLRGYSKTYKAHRATSETGRKPPLAFNTHNWNKPEAHRVLLPEEEKPTQENPKFRGLGSCPKKEGLRLEWLYQEMGTILGESILILSKSQGQMWAKAVIDKGVAVGNTGRVCSLGKTQMGTGHRTWVLCSTSPCS